MKKIIVILIVVGLMLPFSATAVKQVPGTVPQLQPLQPLPPSVKPNVSHNIQDSPAADAVVPADNGDGQMTNNVSNVEDAQNSPAGSAVPRAVGKSTPTRWPVIIVLLIIAVIIGFVYWRWRKPQSSTHDY